MDKTVNSNYRNLILTTLVMIIIGAILITVAPIPFGAQVAAQGVPPAPSEVFVNASYGGHNLNTGDLTPDGLHVWGVNATDTINNGSNMVADNGIVHVAPGTYNENVVINHPLVLEGAKAGVSGSDPSRGTDESIVNASPAGKAVYINSADVTVDGFTIGNKSATYDTGIAFYGDNAVVRDNVILGSSVMHPVEIQGNNANFSFNTVEVPDVNGGLNNLIDGMGDWAIVDNNYLWSDMLNNDINWTGDNGRITNNMDSVVATLSTADVHASTIGFSQIVYTGNNAVISGNTIGNAGWHYNYAIAVAGSGATISSNHINASSIINDAINVTGKLSSINGNTINATEIYGIGINNIGPGSTITNNVISNASEGVYVYGDYATVQKNQLTDIRGEFNVYVEGTHSQILDNTLANNDFISGVGITNYGDFPTIVNNTMTNVIMGISDQGYGANVSLNTINTNFSIGGASLDNFKAQTFMAPAGIYQYGTNSKIDANSIQYSEMFPYGVFIDGSSAVDVRDNTINNVSMGINVTNSIGVSDIAIVNNTIANYGTPDKVAHAYYGIYLDKAVTGATVTDNKVLSDCSDIVYGLMALPTGPITVENNTFENCTNSGILSVNSAYSVLSTGINAETSANGNSLYVNNTILNNLTSNSAGIVVFGDPNSVVRDNVIEDTGGYFGVGIASLISNGMQVQNNTITNAYSGVEIENYPVTAYGIKVDYNTIANSYALPNGGYEYALAIAILGDNNGSISHNNISGVGEWNMGIGCYGYQDMIDGNSIANASTGIAYYSGNYGPYSMMTSIKNNMDASLTKLQGSSNVQVDKVMSSLSSAVTAQSNLPVSDYATIQNNFVNNSNMSYENNGILYYGDTGAIADNTVLGGTANHTIGIGAYVDNVTITGNQVSGVTQPDANVTYLEGGAIVIGSANPGTVKGNAYLANNDLLNNRVQFIFDNVDVFNLDNAGKLVNLNNSTLEQVICANALNSAYYVVLADNVTLKTFGTDVHIDTSGAIVPVLNNSSDASQFADTSAGDQVVQAVYSFKYTLPAGWTMISTPVLLADNATQDLPLNLRANLTDMWYYDQGTWLYYSGQNGFSPNYGHLSNITPGKGYWVDLDQPTNFTLTGVLTTGGAPAVGSGWTMFGLRGLDSISATVPYPKSQDMWYYDQGTWIYYSGINGYSPYYGHLTTLDAGKGYWVNI